MNSKIASGDLHEVESLHSFRCFDFRKYDLVPEPGPIIPSKMLYVISDVKKVRYQNYPRRF